MSYGFRVTAKDGALTVEKTTVEVPDGVWAVSGHDHETGSSMQCSMAERGDGRTVTTVISGFKQA